eukprot:TRINITY_DN30146_c0_g1_i1.p1 TRINITY_DN30146_c0_g1~~TRINITY_DN30146_c0_g1_i1.p1  ORF type:complete len:243 (+),score=111.00 TRINITY_DN30146_c0_g1_i1:49-777(+)
MAGVQKSVKLEGEAWEHFDIGVRAVFAGWSSLSMCVQNADRPGAAQQCVEDMTEDVVDWYQKDGEVFPDEIENYLTGEINDVLHGAIEDGTVRGVADHIYAMYKQCLVGNFALVEESRRQVAGAQETLAKSKTECGIINVDDGDADMDMDMEDGGDEAAPALVPTTPSDILNGLLSDIAQALLTEDFVNGQADQVAVLQAVEKDVQARLVALGVQPAGPKKKKKKTGKNTVEEGADGWMTVK